MTVPVVGSLARKPPWRLLPEIHASRLSVSGSLRPKLGLLILLVLLVLSVCLLLVPLVTRWQAGDHTEVLVLPPREALILSVLRTSSTPNLVFSPLAVHVLVRSLANHTSTASSKEHRAELAKFADSLLLNPSSSDSEGTEAAAMTTTMAAAAAPLNLSLVPKSVARHGGSAAGDLVNHINLSLPLHNLTSLSEENFYTAASGKLVKKVLMAGLRTEANRTRLAEADLFEVSLRNGLLNLEILLPRQVASAQRLTELYEALRSTDRRPQSVRRNIHLKMPMLDLEGVQPILPLLENLGIKNLTKRNDLPRLIHSATFRLTQGVKGSPESGGGWTGEEVRCDRSFIFNVISPKLSLPILTGMFAQP